MSFSEDCCSLPAIASDYKPFGRTFKIDDLEVYETNDTTPNKVLICAYDIFGVHPNIRQVADILAKAGYRIVIPDFFRGHNIIYLMKQIVHNFVQTHGNWNKSVKADILKILKHYQEQEKIQIFGIFGFCWGARIAIDVAREIPEVKAAALLHPSLFKTEDANGVKVPMLLIPSKGEIDMIPFYEILKQNLGDDKCEHHRMNDMHHGFAGARGNFKNELNRQRVDEAIKLMEAFFTKHLPSVNKY